MKGSVRFWTAIRNLSISDTFSLMSIKREILVVFNKTFSKKFFELSHKEKKIVSGSFGIFHQKNFLRSLSVLNIFSLFFFKIIKLTT